MYKKTSIKVVYLICIVFEIRHCLIMTVISRLPLVPSMLGPQSFECKMFLLLVLFGIILQLIILQFSLFYCSSSTEPFIIIICTQFVSLLDHIFHNLSSLDPLRPRLFERTDLRHPVTTLVVLSFCLNSTCLFGFLPQS